MSLGSKTQRGLRTPDSNLMEPPGPRGWEPPPTPNLGPIEPD